MIGDKKILCVITARAGSRGFPGKNYKKIMGKPLFMWSVEAARKSKYVDRSLVSSNCDDCKKIYDRNKILIYSSGKECKEEWLDRPESISGALAKNEEALIHALNTQKEQYDIVINLQPTSPCRLNNLLDRCIETYYKGGYDSLLTASKDTPFIWQKKNKKWVYTVDINDCCNRKMRQEFKDDDFIYHDNGNIYIMDAKVLIESKCRIGKNPYIFETVELNSMQIDNKFDFEIIEQMLKSRKIKSLIA